MGKVYKNQTDVEINLYLKKDLTDVASAIIKYTKPSGVAGVADGNFAATIIVPLTSNGQIQYKVLNSTDLSESGEWTFWAFATKTNGDTIVGECSKITIYEEGIC